MRNSENNSSLLCFSHCVSLNNSGKRWRCKEEDRKKQKVGERKKETKRQTELKMLCEMGKKRPKRIIDVDIVGETERKIRHM